MLSVGQPCPQHLTMISACVTAALLFAAGTAADMFGTPPGTQLGLSTYCDQISLIV